MMNNAQAVAYIRRSVSSRADPGDLSREFQIEACRRLAGPDAADLRIIDGDWGRSAATDSTARRLAFLAMLDDIERGAVRLLVAYSADRLARSVEWSARLLNACRRAGVPIITGEGRFDPTNGATTDLYNFRAVVNESAVRQMQEKAAATIARRKARNVEAGREPNAGLGGKPYGPEVTAQVLAAYDQAGSFLGACKLLTAPVGAEVWSRGRLIGTGMGVPSRLGGRPNPRQNGGAYGWNFRTVGRIVRRERTDVPKVGRQGAAQRPRRRLSGLLVCHCGQILAPNGTANYTCRKAHNDSSHSRPYTVSERRLLPAIKAEAAHLRHGITELQDADPTAELATLEAERARLLYQHQKHYLTDAELDHAIAPVVAQMDALRRGAAPYTVPEAVSWSAPVPKINDQLRALFRSITLGAGLLPLPYPEGFAWTVPEWRAAD